MSRHPERNPEIRKVEDDLPLFAEQSFYQFEQKSGRTETFPSAGENGDCRSLRDAQSSSSSPRDLAHARKSDRITSHQAAASVVNLGRTRQAIIAILRVHPLTDEQLWEQYKLGMNAGITDFPKRTQSGLRSRRSELVDMGFVEACGIGKTQAKRNCTVWRLTPMGEQK